MKILNPASQWRQVYFRLVFTMLNPLSRGRYDGVFGTVTRVVFCKSDGKTILYGVKFDTPMEGAKGLCCESFELEAL